MILLHSVYPMWKHQEMQTMSMPTLQICVPLWPSLKDQDATARQEARNHGVGYESWPLYAATQPTDAIDGVQRTLSNMRFPELTTSNYMKI